MAKLSVNLVFGAVLVVATTAAKSPSVIMSILIDDLGIYDTSVYNPNAPTPFLGKLSHEQGMILHRHYTYKVINSVNLFVHASVCT